MIASMGFATTASLLLFLFFAQCSSSGVVSYGRKTYVVVSIQHGTPKWEFSDLFEHYIKLQTQCSTCVPPAYGLPATFYFGPKSTPWVVNASGEAVTDELRQLLNDTYAFEKVYTTVQSEVNGRVTNDSEHLDQQLKIVVDEMISAKLNNMTLKTLIIITNYFSPNSYSIAQNLNKTYMNFAVQSFTITDFEINTNLTQVLATNSNAFQRDSQILLNTTINSPYSCEERLCKVGLFFELYYHEFSYMGRLLEHKFTDPNILFLNEAAHMSLNVFVMGLIHSKYRNITIFATSPWMGANNTLDYLKAQIYDWAHAETSLNHTHFYKLESDYILGTHAGVTVPNSSYVAMIADAIPLEFIKVLNESPSRPVSQSHYVDIVLLDTYRQYISPMELYEWVTKTFLVLPTTVSKQVGNHVIAVNKTNDKFGWISEYGIMSSVSASAPLGPATHPSHMVTIICSIVGGVLAFVIVVIAIFFWYRRRRRRQAVRKVQDVRTEEVALPDGFRIAVSDVDVKYDEVLGKGVTSVVYKAFIRGAAHVHRTMSSSIKWKFTNCDGAIKMPIEFNYTELIMINKELEAYRRLKYHEHILPCLGWVEMDCRKCLVFELAPMGDLRKYVVAMRDVPSDLPGNGGFAPFIPGPRASALQDYVAQCKMVHRDLAARNILLTADRRAKISDFGLCCDCDETFTYTATLSKRLPIRWLSLEALVDRVFSEKSDVWSCGVLIYEVFSKGVTPYAALSNAEIVDFLAFGDRLERPPLASDDVAATMRSCWEEDVARRPSFEELARTFEEMLEKGAEHYGYLIA
uniref:Protein kinase domain-containing protein n=1 Tax=Steinernema glaseri TaxID=37863 RepID=A0A1I8AT27_9BILA